MEFRDGLARDTRLERARSLTRDRAGRSPASLLLALEGQHAQPRAALGLQLLRPVLARSREAHHERVLAQLVDAAQRLALVRTLRPHRVDLLGLLRRIDLVRPLDLLALAQAVLLPRHDQPNLV